MAALAYLDSSAIVKLAVREVETDAFETYVVGREALVSSRLSEVEVVRAARRVRGESGRTDLQAQVEEALAAVFLRVLDADVLRRASLLEPLQLRTLDAIHLATALIFGDPAIEFVTYDDRLARAAHATGLQVVQPGLTAPRPTRAHAPEVPRGSRRASGARKR